MWNVFVVLGVLVSSGQRGPSDLARKYKLRPDRAAVVITPVADPKPSAKKRGLLLQLENNTTFRIVLYNLPTIEPDETERPGRGTVCAPDDIERVRDDSERAVVFTTEEYKPHYSLVGLLLLEPGQRVRFVVNPRAAKPLARIEVSFFYEWEADCAESWLMSIEGVGNHAYYTVPFDR